MSYETPSMRYHRIMREGIEASKIRTMADREVYLQAGNAAVEAARAAGYTGQNARAFSQGFCLGLDQLVRVELR